MPIVCAHVHEACPLHGRRRFVCGGEDEAELSQLVVALVREHLRRSRTAEPVGRHHRTSRDQHAMDLPEDGRLVRHVDQ